MIVCFAGVSTSSGMTGRNVSLKTVFHVSDFESVTSKDHPYLLPVQNMPSHLPPSSASPQQKFFFSFLLENDFIISFEIS
jgi:hypothetical protein